MSEGQAPKPPKDRSWRYERGKLGGLKRRQVIRLLAAAELTQAEIARRYGVTDGAITQFKDRHEQEILAVREKMDEEFAGIAIADKVNRVAMLEEIAEKAMEPTPRVDNKGFFVVDPVTGEHVYEFDGRLAAQVLKQAAEEMGQLVQRSSVTADVGVTTNYKIDGVDPGALM